MVFFYLYALNYVGSVHVNCVCWTMVSCVLHKSAPLAILILCAVGRQLGYLCCCSSITDWAM